MVTTAEASSNLSRFDGAKYGYRTKKSPINLDSFTGKTARVLEKSKKELCGTFVGTFRYYDAYFSKPTLVESL